MDYNMTDNNTKNVTDNIIQNIINKKMSKYLSAYNYKMIDTYNSELGSFVVFNAYGDHIQIRVLPKNNKSIYSCDNKFSVFVEKMIKPYIEYELFCNKFGDIFIKIDTEHYEYSIKGFSIFSKNFIKNEDYYYINNIINIKKNPPNIYEPHKSYELYESQKSYESYSIELSNKKIYNKVKINFYSFYENLKIKPIDQNEKTVINYIKSHK